MRSANATKVHRKSGVAKRRDLLFLFRFSHTLFSPDLFRAATARPKPDRTQASVRAFGEYHAHRIFLDVFVTNDRARHVYERFGFRKEGIMRDAVYRDGSYHSLVLMSLLESEYRLGSEARANEATGKDRSDG